MATNSSSSTTTSSTSTGRSATDGNDLLELRETDTSDLESAADDNWGGVDAAAKAAETTTPSGSDGLSEALKAERRRSNNLEKELRGLRQQLTRFSEINPQGVRPPAGGRTPETAPGATTGAARAPDGGGRCQTGGRRQCRTGCCP
jgi:hypothetical protein